MAEGTGPANQTPDQVQPPQPEALKTPEGQLVPKLELSDVTDKTLEAYEAQKVKKAGEYVKRGTENMNRLEKITV